MKTLLLLLAVLATPLSAQDWRRAEPGWKYEWPRDHGAHRDFKTEWWYFTGNLRADDGRRFGYQVTFFRQGIRPPNARSPVRSRFIMDDLMFGHFTITDVGANRFSFSQKVLRGAFGEAGFSDSGKLAWLGDWTLELPANNTMLLHASDGALRLDLRLESTKPWAVHGESGASQKAELPGHASHYYSGTRLATRGTLHVDGRPLAVTGESWFDHEWASSQLAPGQSGWDWFSVQFNDGSELMIYQLRKKDGTIDGASSGSFIAPDGTVQHLRRDEMRLNATKFWQSTKTKARYPIGWEIEIPKLGIRFNLSTPMESQELVLNPISYWEGMIDVEGTREGRPLSGHGYLELTGYAGDVVGLSSSQ